MALAFRLTGWTLTLVGMGIFIFGGGFGEDHSNPVGWAGIFVFLGGMILTSLSGLIHNLQYRSKLRKKAELAAQEAARPSKSK